MGSQWDLGRWLPASGQQAQRSLAAAKKDGGAAGKQSSAVDLDAAKSVFEARCSQCHSPALVAASPPTNEVAATELVSRMVRNGLRADDEELMQITAYSGCDVR